MSGSNDRRHPRYAVHFTVRFSIAREFVAEYAENLSVGGLFVRGAHRLDPLSEIEIALELPGLGQYTVTGRVAHVIDEELAKKSGRAPGAGMEITSSPPGFDDALLSYLHRLGRRRDHMVLADIEPIRSRLADSGYQAQLAPSAADLAAVIARQEAPVLGVVVHQSHAQDYRAAAIRTGAGEIVRHYGELDDFGAILALLDGDL
jgi:hypothetical protein